MPTIKLVPNSQPTLLSFRKITDFERAAKSVKQAQQPDRVPVFEYLKASSTKIEKISAQLTNKIRFQLPGLVLSLAGNWTHALPLGKSGQDNVNPNFIPYQDRPDLPASLLADTRACSGLLKSINRDRLDAGSRLDTTLPHNLESADNEVRRTNEWRNGTLRLSPAPKEPNFLTDDRKNGSRDYGAICKDPSSNTIIIGFHGVDDFGEAASAAGQRVGYIDSRFEKAASVVEDLIKHNPNVNILVTGHCYGGELAAYAAAKNGCRALVINGSPFSPHVAEKLYQSTDEEKLRSAQVDYVNNTLDAIQPKFVLGSKFIGPQYKLDPIERGKEKYVGREAVDLDFGHHSPQKILESADVRMGTHVTRGRTSNGSLKLYNPIVDQRN